MSNFEISDYQLSRECDALADEIFEDMLADMAEDETPEDYRDKMYDRAHESADGHEWVIYTHKAIMLCAHCSTNQGDEFLSDTGLPADVTFGGLATVIAYGEIRARIELHLNELIDEWADAHDAEDAA